MIHFAHLRIKEGKSVIGTENELVLGNELGSETFARVVHGDGEEAEAHEGSERAELAHVAKGPEVL